MRWLATDSVVIDGVLDLSGREGVAGGSDVEPREGGPGGFGGGIGGTPSFQGSSFAGSPGLGPGGGLPGTNSNQNGQSGTYASTYGNPFIEPLIGGSGGGGGGSTVGASGSFGGGGGGALLIASSKDIVVNGQILANGGKGFSGSGAGSGGAIRLWADRIIVGASGRLEATPDGRIRLESFQRNLAGTIFPTNILNTIVGTPSSNPAANAEPRLVILSVAGKNVVQPPAGDLFNPDVTFSEPGEITVTVRGQSIPDGTPVKLRLTMTGGFIDKPAAGEPDVVLAGGNAAFTLAVPRGKGTVQAFATATLANP